MKTTYDQPYTIIADVKIPSSYTTTLNNAPAAILGRGSYSSGAQGFSVNNTVTNFEYRLRTASSNNTITLGSIVKDQWFHLVGI